MELSTPEISILMLSLISIDSTLIHILDQFQIFSSAAMSIEFDPGCAAIHYFKSFQVNSKVAEFEETRTDDKGTVIVKQMPEFRSMLRKDWILYPTPKNESQSYFKSEQ